MAGVLLGTNHHFARYLRFSCSELPQVIPSATSDGSTSSVSTGLPLSGCGFGNNWRDWVPHHPSRGKSPEPHVVKRAAKWVLILWSLFCLFGVVVGMSNVGKSMAGMNTDPERAGATIGFGCGMAMWVGIWAAIALPALVIFLVSGKAPPQIPTTPTSSVKLCPKCGKYYDGTPTFCPNCGCQLMH